MDDLVAWLLAAIAEDEHYASYVVNNDYANSNAVWFEPSSGMVDTGDGQFSACADSSISRHIIRWDPARALAECEAKRRIIGHWPDPMGMWTAEQADAARAEKVNTLKLLALPYADRPGYREEWRP